MQDQLKYSITNGPDLLKLFRSLERHVDNAVFDVRFEWKDDCGRDSAMNIQVQGMERPQRSGFWKIRASHIDLCNRFNNEINVIMIYDPVKRAGYLDFTGPQPSKLRTAAPPHFLPVTKG